MKMKLKRLECKLSKEDEMEVRNLLTKMNTIYDWGDWEGAYGNRADIKRVQFCGRMAGLEWVLDARVSISTTNPLLNVDDFNKRAQSFETVITEAEMAYAKACREIKVE